MVRPLTSGINACVRAICGLVPRFSFSKGSWCNRDGGHGTAVWWWWWWLSWWWTWWCASMPWCRPPLPSCTGWWKDADEACCSATLWCSEPVDDTKSCRHRLGSVRFSRRSIISAGSPPALSTANNGHNRIEKPKPKKTAPANKRTRQSNVISRETFARDAHKQQRDVFKCNFIDVIAS